MLDMIYSVDEIKEKIESIFVKYGVREAVLFGSYVKGKARKNSDVDIIVDSGLRGLEFFGLLEDVVNSLNKEVDLLEVSQVIEDSIIMEEIKKSGVKIYG